VSIVSIARGGLIPGGILTKLLDVENFVSYGVSSYDGEDQGEFNVYQPLPSDYKPGDGDILVVDDLAHTGKTFEHVCKEIKKITSQNIITIAPYIKTGTIVMPDFWATEYPEETWLEFPWEL